MDRDQIILFSLFALVFAGLLWGRWRYDLVAFTALVAGVLLGVVPEHDAFAGFGHPAVMIVALVLLVSAGLVRSGAVLLITRTLIDTGRSVGAHIAVMGTVGGVLSAFMNNVAALALLMPVDVATAKKAGRHPGLTLMPLSFATILGGMATLIGTPPNIIIAQMRGTLVGEPYQMFDFAPVGITVALIGLVFVALIGWRLIPSPGSGAGQGGDLSIYLAELIVPEGADVVGQRLAELEDEAEKADVALLGIARGGKRLRGIQRNTVLQAGDALVVEAGPEALEEFRAMLKLKLAEEDREAKLKAEAPGLNMVELVVPEGARIVGKSAQAMGLFWRQRSVLLGISRQGKRLTTRVRQTPIAAGDILLMLVPEESASDVADWIGALTLADRGLAVTQDSKTWSAIGLFAAAVLLASLGLVYLPVALGAVVVGFVLLGILPLGELYDNISWPVIVLLGSMIPLGSALETSGGTQLIADGLLWLSGSLPSWAVLTLLMMVTMSLSDVLNNTATAIVAAPVAVAMAHGLEASPDPFLMAVAVASSCAFLTPIGHKNNMLILGPGGYKFGDYWRMGLPLEIIVVASGVPAILFFWPL
ncbi:SLC13 family permease [Frigidibacter sp. ROC022]|uniref:SLC13 family permease n=1 Tax=Frigidibacter sp. ROC022 TaxID=2971796 RepID=UPI00215A6197|nr:SLC13 family permease [Frigidibacter sp. ROC022]MCR8726671.1 SLC13 family permease [Frigidibacter sp. ROC022]